MFVIGHVGSSLFLAVILGLNPIVSSASVLLPDMIDKPLNILGLAPCSRFIGHTLLMGLLLSIFIYVFTRNKKITSSLLMGYWLHLIEDMRGFVPFFYPFINYSFPVKQFTVHYGIFEFVSDIVGFLMIIWTYHNSLKFKMVMDNILTIIGYKNGRYKPEKYLLKS